MKSLLRDSLIVIFITAILFGLIEVSFRLFAPQEIIHVYKDEQSLALRDSVLGHVYRPDASSKVRGPEFTVEYKINAFGMRDEAFHPAIKPENTLRILILGDSFAFGAANDYQNIWPVVFERALTQKGYKIDVMKAGVSAYDTKKEVLYLERLYPDYHPDVVVLNFLPNDLFTNTPIAVNPAAEAWADLNSDEPVVRAQEDKTNALHSVLFAKRMLLSNDFFYTRLYLLTRRSDYFSMPLSENLQKQISITQQILQRATDFCEQRGARFVVLFIPQQFQVIVKAKELQFENINVVFIDELFYDFAREKNFFWITTLPTLVEHYKSNDVDLYFRLDGHLNKYGNQLVGDYFAAEFEKIFAQQLSPTKGYSQ
ncbi:hypothetical protein EH223_16605 [candidate division KSB1 bacterium]|nr:hypothetical protein [candidate division KSB1 bacterium]RQW00968.1 MAG: hypothetical protein EH223_16605 [candidate division KSB1 bacterium]